MAFWGFSPSICQLFGASSWAHIDELQAQGCRFDQSSRALESVDDTWQLERRIAHNARVFAGSADASGSGKLIFALMFGIPASAALGYGAGRGWKSKTRGGLPCPGG